MVPLGTKRFDPKSNGIVVFVSIRNGRIKRRIRMVVDTGSTFNMVPWVIVEALGYQPGLSKHEMPITTANGQIHVPKVIIGETHASGRSALDCITVVHDLPETSRVDGLLGLSFLKNFIMYRFPPGCSGIEIDPTTGAMV